MSAGSRSEALAAEPAKAKTLPKGYVNLEHMAQEAGVDLSGKEERDRTQAAAYEEVDTSVIASLAASAQSCKPTPRNKVRFLHGRKSRGLTHMAVRHARGTAKVCANNTAP